MSQKYYGYIYLITDQKNKKIYIWQKVKLPEKSTWYYGSGTIIRDIIKSRGTYFLKKRILGILEADSKKELKILLNEAEKECVYFFRAYGADGEHYDTIYGYNLTKGGDTPRKDIPMTEEAKRHLRELSLNIPKSKEHCLNISKGLMGNTNMKGKKQTIETINKNNK